METNQNKVNKLHSWAPTILRLGFVFVFLYFGINQIQNPSAWLSFLPKFVNSLPVSEIDFVKLNGLFEIAGATLLFFGIFTRIVAFILAIHLLAIAMSIGFTPIGVRDFGLFVACLTLSMLGAGKLAIDKK